MQKIRTCIRVSVVEDQQSRLFWKPLYPATGLKEGWSVTFYPCPNRLQVIYPRYESTTYLAYSKSLDMYKLSHLLHVCPSLALASNPPLQSRHKVPNQLL
jgi:hypothetical protein